MNLLCLFAVVVTGVLCGDVTVPPTEASMRRIINLGRAIDDPDVQWLMKQTDLMLVIVSSPHWITTLEMRQNFINVIEHFVLATISGPRGIDIREAAMVFERYRLDFHSDDFYSDAGTDERYKDGDLSMFALSLAFDLERYAPTLPKLLSDPDFPLDAHRRVIFLSLSSIFTRLPPQLSRFYRGYYKSQFTPHPTEYLEMLLHAFTKVEDQYTRLCQQSGVDVQYTYRPMVYLGRLRGLYEWEAERLIESEILPMIEDPQTMDFAISVGRCFDFALRHHPHPSESRFHSLGDHPARSLRPLNGLVARWFGEDADMICDELITQGFPRDSHFVAVPTPSTDLADANPPIPMEFADTRTIRVTRLVEVVAVLGVPEIRDVFQAIDGPESMSKFERIVWDELNQLNREGVRMERLAYNLSRYLGIRILQYPMMRERYFNHLSEEQFEEFRRIISCMAHLAPLIGNQYALDRLRDNMEIEVMTFIRHALEHPDEIALISRGLQALTRSYKQFQQDPIRPVSRSRTVVGFLPAYLVFGRSDFRSSSPMDRAAFGNFNAQKFREGLEWVIGHECAFASRESLTRLVTRDLFCLEQPMGIVLEFLSFPAFEEMVLAIDRIFRVPTPPTGSNPNYRFSNGIGRYGFDIPRRIFAAVMRLGGLRAIEAPLRNQLLRIVPVLAQYMRTLQGRLMWGRIQQGFGTLQRVLDGQEPGDAAYKLKAALDYLEDFAIRPLLLDDLLFDDMHYDGND